jgi:hypothetical protein
MTVYKSREKSKCMRPELVLVLMKMFAYIFIYGELVQSTLRKVGLKCEFIVNNTINYCVNFHDIGKENLGHKS